MRGQRRAIVVGAGIGGLATAIGLHRAGLHVTVLERAPELAGVGSGITLWPNAIRGLRALGLGPRIDPLLSAQPDGGLLDATGRRLLQWDGARLERRLGGPALAVHRAWLIDVLREALPVDRVRTATTVTQVRTTGRVVTDRGEFEANLVVAADGVHSTTRRGVWPEHPGAVGIGVVAFRAVLDGASDLRPGITLGAGTEFGLVPLPDEQVYWWAALTDPCRPDQEPQPALRRHFRAWHADVRAAVERTPAEAILRHDLRHLATPLASYHRGAVALLGDAAHAMTPFLGQGACQAIEDAVELADAAAHRPLPEVPAAYDHRRRSRSQAVARASMRTGRGGALVRRPLAVRARDQLLRLLPSGVGARLLASPSAWTPPELPDRRT